MIGGSIFSKLVINYAFCEKKKNNTGTMMMMNEVCSDCKLDSSAPVQLLVEI